MCSFYLHWRQSDPFLRRFQCKWKHILELEWSQYAVSAQVRQNKRVSSNVTFVFFTSLLCLSGQYLLVELRWRDRTQTSFNVSIVLRHSWKKMWTNPVISASNTKCQSGYLIKKSKENISYEHENQADVDKVKFFLKWHHHATVLLSSALGGAELESRNVNKG